MIDSDAFTSWGLGLARTTDSPGAYFAGEAGAWSNRWKQGKIQGNPIRSVIIPQYKTLLLLIFALTHAEMASIRVSNGAAFPGRRRYTKT
jgi:hypothetical protein